MFYEEFQAYRATEDFQSIVRNSVSSRKLRLLVCACARGIWHLIHDERGNRAVEVAERFVDGLADRAELDSAWMVAGAANDEECAAWEAKCVPQNAQEADPYGVHEVLCDACNALATCHAAATPDERQLKERAIQSLHDSATAEAHAILPLNLAFTAYNAPSRRAALTRAAEAHQRLVFDIFGDPKRSVAFDPEWRTSTVMRLAQHIYEARDFSTMPILADALQDAGCNNADILSHCRDTSATHVRGCWVVDMILGKS